MRPSRETWAKVGLVYAATLVAYWPALRGGFIWDDDFHVTRPVLRSLHGLGLIWFHLGQTAQYYPLLHSAFWLEHRLWGDSVFGYHLVNVLLHATSACLFGLILHRLLGGKSAGSGRFLDVPLLGALLFALHPVCVESVAWISEQKNTLSTVFYLLAMLTYLAFDRRWNAISERVLTSDRGQAENALGDRVPPTRHRAGLYVLSLALFLCAMLSKSVTATLPAALLVIIWWKRGRLSWKTDVLPLLPWFGVAAAGGLFTAWVERTTMGANGSAFALGALQRCLLAGRVVWFYLGKLVWPANLTFIYPHWNVDAAVAGQYLYPFGLLAAFAVLVWRARRARGLLAGALLYVGSLFPVLGFFNVYPFRYSYVADHFQYLASLAMFGLVAAGYEAITNNDPRKVGSRKAPESRMSQSQKVESPTLPTFWDRPPTFGGLPTSYFQWIAALVLLLLASLTWHQCRIYRDAETLYRTTISRNPECWLAYNNLGNLMLDRGQDAEAAADYAQVFALKDDDAEPHNNMGLALAGLRQYPAAIAQYREALRLRPDYPQAHRNLAISLRRTGDLAGSIAECDEAIRLASPYPEARADRARALAAQGRLREAIADYEEALRLQPSNPETHADYGTALSASGRLPDAIGQYEEALRLKPDYAEVCNNLGVALAQANRLPEALDRFEQAVRLKPDYADARDNIALILQSLGRPREAQAQSAEAARIRSARR